jgi:primosomal protein N' (replication factor Y)
MTYAEVIVDVTAKTIDKPFDYRIPEKWNGIVKKGMRVVVPFGPRRIQGFVTAVKDKTDVPEKSIKTIEELLDLTPALTNELLTLSEWLSKRTLSLQIVTLQAMLPSALKAKYEKELRIRPGFEPGEPIKALFNGRTSINMKELTDSTWLREIQKQVQSGNLEMVYKVAQKTTEKTISVVRALLPKKELMDARESLPANAKKQKELLSFFIEAKDQTAVPASDLFKLTGSSQSSLRKLLEKGFLKESKEEIYRDPYENKTFGTEHSLPLTLDQESAYQSIRQAVDRQIHDVFLLHGVTGSGKTEVYLQIIEKTLNNGKEAIVLVPEISLTPQMVDRFKKRFGSLVAVMHSGLSAGEKYDEWRKIQRKEVRLVVGARSAVFAPFENLGMIIIDEEHESSYKQEEMPRYHARDVAIKRGELHKCPVVLGSATPSLESFARAKKDVYKLLSLPNRVNQKTMPLVTLVDMREEMRKGNRSMFSERLMLMLQQTLEKKEQAVLFLNKRGYSAFIMCRDCGYVIKCPHCEISLTYHRFSNNLKCHYCGHEESIPNQCPECGSEHIRYFGTGTQRVEEELTKVLPEARVIRMDVDTTSRKGAHEKLLTSFGNGQADILLGTQMIAKGLDFKNVTLVGVLSADTMLHIPDFRSAEKTFQLLTQVSGRAGRHEKQGQVIIQSYEPAHYSIQLTKTHDYLTFFHQEMHNRREQSYPPYYFLAMINISHKDVMKAALTAEKIVGFLKTNSEENTVILGPSASPIARIKDRYRYQCVIKYKQESKIILLLKQVMGHFGMNAGNDEITVTIDMNPYMMM